MTKKTIDSSELQTLTISPTNTVEEENAPFLASNENYADTSSDKETDQTENQSGNLSQIPSFRLSTPGNQGYSRVSYLNEKEKKKNDSEGEHEPLDNKKDQPSSSFGRSNKLYIKGPPRPPLPTRDTKREFLALKSPGIDPMSSTKIFQNGYLNKRKEVYSSHEGIPMTRSMERPTQHHTFITDAADVRQIEDGLLQLMEEFHIGNLRAFGKDSRLRQMEEIREQQERLARLHFDVGAEQEQYPPLSEDGLRVSEENMRKVMEKLAQLSESIENLHTNTNERKSTHSAPSHSETDLPSKHQNKSGPVLSQPPTLISSSSSEHFLPGSSKSYQDNQVIFSRQDSTSPNSATPVNSSKLVAHAVKLNIDER